METTTKGSSSWLKASIILLLLSSAAAGANALTTDGLALLALKSAVSLDPTNALSTWLDSDATPCTWRGVTCARDRVAELALADCALAGYIPSELSLLSALQSLVISGNRFSGPFPVALAELGNLSELDLSQNRLSGLIPPEIGRLSSLSHLDLSANFLNGTLPLTIAALPHLSGVLNLSYNLLSGPIPAAYGNIPVTVSLDLTRNNLSGEIPQVGSLVNQGPTAFAGNPNLCGFPLKNICPNAEKNPKEPQPSLNFTLKPSSRPPGSQSPEAERRSKPTTTILILTAVVLAALLAILVLQWQFRRHRPAAEDEGVKKEKSAAATAATLWEEKREGRESEIFAAVDEGFALELEELLRAAAYVVGKSRSGIIYKVVVAGGDSSAVAVRRLSEVDDGEGGAGGGDDLRRRRAFESEAIAIGRARHLNVVRLLAYYYAPDERLLIYDYIANGNLQAVLHGGVLNPAAAPLPWAARLAILQGVAGGLAYIHEFSPRKYVHGNLKSSKILLDDDLRPYISGFGLSRLISAGAQKLAHSGPAKKLGAAQAMGSTRAAAPPCLVSGYTPPEVRGASGGQQQITQKGDVYAFGVLAMEVATGRAAEGLEGWVRAAFKEERPLSEVVDPALLHEVHAKKEVLAVFHVALGCTESDPDLRPRMRTVVESLDQTGVAAR